MKKANKSFVQVKWNTVGVQSAAMGGIFVVVAALVYVGGPPLVKWTTGQSNEESSASGLSDDPSARGDVLSADVIDAAMLKLSGRLELVSPIFNSPGVKEHAEVLIRRAVERVAAMAASSDPEVKSGLRLFLEGAEDFGERDYSSAAALLYAATQRLPETAEVHALLALARLQIDDAEAAVKSCQRSIDLEPRVVPWHLLCAASHMVAEDWGAARKTLHEALELDARLAWTHLLLGMIAYQQGDFLAATSFVKAAIERHNTIPFARSLLGACYFELRYYEEAVIELELAVKEDPRDAEAFNNLCAAYAKMSNRESAIRACRSALAIKPTYAPSHHNLATLLMLEKDYEGVVDLAKEALQNDPSDVTAGVQLAQAQVELGRLDDAVERYRAVLASDPTK